MQLTTDFENFEPWGQAVGVWNYVNDVGKVGNLEFFLEDMYPDGMSTTELNDLLAYEPETLLPYIGLFGNLPTISESDIKIDLGNDPDKWYSGTISITTDMYADIELEFSVRTNEDGVIDSVEAEGDAMISWGSYNDTDDYDVLTSDIVEQLEEIYLGDTI